VKIDHALRQLAAQLVDAGDNSLKVVAVFDSGGLGDLLYRLAIKADKVGSQNGVIIVGG
jgi:hypothetical protein